MANSGEALFQRDIIEAITAYGWEVGIAGGCEHTGEEVSERDLTHYQLTKRNEKRLRQEGAEGDYGLTPVSDDDKLHFVNGIGDHTGRDGAVMARIQNQCEDQVMHGLFLKKATDAALDAHSGHEKLSIPLLAEEETDRQFTSLSLRLLVSYG